MKQIKLAFVLCLLIKTSLALVCNNAQHLQGEACIPCPLGKTTPQGFFVLESKHATINTAAHSPVLNAWNSGNFTSMFVDGSTYEINQSQIPHAEVAFIALNASVGSQVIVQKSLRSIPIQVSYYAKAYDAQPSRQETRLDEAFVLDMHAYEKITVTATQAGTVKMQWGQDFSNATTCVECAPGFYRNDLELRSCLPCAPRHKSRGPEQACERCADTENSEDMWASQECVPCGVHRRYDDAEQAFVPGCPWCPTNTDREVGRDFCESCRDGYGRAETSENKCSPSYVNQDRCPGEAEIDNLEKRSNCSCLSLEYVAYKNISSHPTLCSNITDHNEWRPAQYSNVNQSMLCTLRTCLPAATCDPTSQGSAIRWKNAAIDHAKLHYSDLGAFYIEWPSWVRGHLHTSRQCPSQACATKSIDVISPHLTGGKKYDSVLVLTGVVFLPYERMPTQSRGACRELCFANGEQCQWYAWDIQSSACFYDMSQRLWHEFNVTGCSDVIECTQYLQNEVGLVKNTDFSDLGLDFLQLQLFYRQYESRRWHELQQENAVKLSPATVREISGSQDEQLQICAEFCASLLSCTYFSFKSTSDTKGACHYGTQNNHDPPADMTEALQIYDTYLMRTLDPLLQNAQPLCVESNRFYHSTSKIFACPPGQVLRNATAQCLACGENQVNPKDPECFVKTYNASFCQVCKTCPDIAIAGSCRKCGGAERLSITVTDQCEPCPLHHVQSETSAYQCRPCAQGHEAVTIGNHTACQLCREGYAGNPLDGLGCILCPETARNGVMCQCPPGFFTVNNDECRTCAPGTFTDGFGAQHCTTCVPGTAAPGPQSSRCLPCVRDRGANYTTSEFCLPPLCEPGKNYTFCLEEEEPEACAVEFEAVALRPGRFGCVPCGRGWCKPESGAGLCRPCHLCSDYSQIALHSVEHALELYATAPALIPPGSEDMHCGLEGDAPGVDRDSCACKPGFGLANDGFTCVKCANGSSTTQYNDTRCHACELPNQYDPHSGLCHDAPPLCIDDRVPNIGIDSSCVCPAGTYLNDSCVLCPLGSFKVWPGNDLAACRACSPYEISTNDRTGCQQCPDNEVRTDALVCACDRGYEKVDALCRACDKGFFKADFGNGACTECGPGFFTAWYAETKCEACDPLQYDARYCTCAPGTERLGSTCSPCPAGSFKHSWGNTRCEACGLYSEGNTSNQTGRTSCGSCIDEKPILSTDYAGSMCAGCAPHCTCKPGTYLVQDFCETCPLRKFKATWGNESCMDCNANTDGFYGGTGRTSCGQCIDQRYLNVTDYAGTACTFCGPEDYGPRDRCSYCTLGANDIDPETGACSCPSERPELVENTCQRCATGERYAFPLQMHENASILFHIKFFLQEYFFVSSTLYKGFNNQVNLTRDSATGYWQTTRYPHPNFYPSEFFLQSRQEHRQFIHSQEYAFDHMSQSGVYRSYGTYLAFGEKQCLPCGSDGNASILFWQHDSDQQIFSDDPDFHPTVASAVAAQHSVVKQTGWLPFFWCSHRQQCPPEFQITGNDSRPCALCPHRTTNRDGGKCMCVSGYELTTSTQTCTACVPGKYKNQVGDHACSACPPGSYQPEHGQTTCVCEDNYYAVPHESGICAPCPHEFVRYADQDACKHCNETLQDSTVCCLAGHEGIQISTCTCDPDNLFCPCSTYAGSALTECVACTPGKYKTTYGSVACQNCLALTYSEVAGSTSCIGCAINKVTLGEGKSQCISCPRGKYKNNYEDQCLQCPVGKTTRSNEAGAMTAGSCDELCLANADHDCLRCAAGKYTNEHGCTDCPSGKYQPNAGQLGQSSCLNCPLNCPGDSSRGYWYDCGGSNKGIDKGSDLNQECDTHRGNRKCCGELQCVNDICTN